MRQIGNVVLYYGSNDVFSHHYPSTFYVKNVKFSCVEQFLMYCKAMFFQDFVTAQNIMATDDPVMHLRLGRTVNPYNDAAWSQRREHYAFIGNMAKFSQNLDARNLLLSTDNLLIAEASPINLIWGTGLDIMHPDAGNPTQWRGHNLAGKVLMNVRRELSLMFTGPRYAKVA